MPKWIYINDLLPPDNSTVWIRTTNSCGNPYQALFNLSSLQFTVQVNTVPSPGIPVNVPVIYPIVNVTKWRAL